MVAVLYFNSIKVRLELEGPDPLPYRDDEFQFHKGAIRTKSADRRIDSI